MRYFSCPVCCARVFFESTTCLSCGVGLAYDPVQADMHLSQSALPCSNSRSAGCNWVADPGAGNGLCVSCGLNRLVPPLADPGLRAKWARVEAAKRQVLAGCFQLGLLDPALPIADLKPPLSFRLLSDRALLPEGEANIVTGHDGGLITLDVQEADDDIREAKRVRLGEPYRTLVGHFRHELGHYFWELLIAPGAQIADFRALFGDERADYAKALKTYYANPPLDWQGAYISRYAASHPHEDWAESFAHYLHIVDMVDTSDAYGLSQYNEGGSEDPFYGLLERWHPLCEALNALNRSVGMPDAYPFTHSPHVVAKLRFVQRHLTIATPAPVCA